MTTIKKCIQYCEFHGRPIYSGICNTCKNIFYTTKYNAMLCSKKCRIGENAPNWKGGYIKAGYKYIGVHTKQMFEHRHIMEKYLKRKLEKGKVVHHINHDKLDNRIENLQVMSHSNHAKLHHQKEHCLRNSKGQFIKLTTSQDHEVSVMGTF